VRLRCEGRPLCIGHRGAAALAPANTRESIEAALEAGVDMVEIDVLSLPGRGVVLTHSAREAAPEPMTLDDALAVIAPAGADVLLDVKRPGYARELVEILRRHDLVERALASTTSLAVLGELAALEPRLARSVTYPRSRGRAMALERFPRALPWRVGALLTLAEASAATLNYRIVTASVVERCHSLGAAVFAWTVNDEPLARRLAEHGVDGLITDDPAICRATLTA
jgi:glycerophosphoryl diester phosphodiesterase